MKNSVLIKVISKSTQLTQRNCEQVLSIAIDMITNALSEGKSIKIHEFGSFSLRNHAVEKPNNNGNPSSHQTPKEAIFNPGKSFRDAVKKNHFHEKDSRNKSLQHFPAKKSSKLL